MGIPGKMPAVAALVACSVPGFACGSGSSGSAGPNDARDMSDAAGGSTTPVADGSTPVSEASASRDSSKDESQDSSGSGTANGDAAAGGDAGFPPLDPSTLIADLTAMQRGELCDWMFGELGGYGTVVTCTASTVQNPPDQAFCVAHSLMFRCNVTVGDVEMCTVARVPSMGCDTPTACDGQYCN